MSVIDDGRDDQPSKGRWIRGSSEAGMGYWNPAYEVMETDVLAVFRVTPQLRQARRLVELHQPLSRDDLITFTAEDILGSSPFEGRPAETSPAVQSRPHRATSEPPVN